MKALLINGSPNAKGCTFTALSLVAEELVENATKQANASSTTS